MQGANPRSLVFSVARCPWGKEPLAAAAFAPEISEPKTDGETEMADGSASFEPSGASTVAGERLKLFIERVERLEEDKKAVMDDIKEVFAEAKGEGYDTKVMRQIVRLRKMDHADRQEQEALLELYLSALGEA